MTDLNVKKEYLNLIYADCGKGSAGEKIKELVTVPGTQYLIFGVILGVFPLLAQLGILTSSFVFAMGNTMIYAIMAIGFCLLMGYSGLASLGTAGFVGIGAYIAYYFMQVYPPFIAYNIPEHFRRCGHRRSQVSMGHHLRSVHHLRTAVNAPEQDSLLRGEPGVHYHDYGSAYHPHRNVLPWRHSSNDGEPYEKEKNSKIRCQYAKEGGRLWPELTERTEK